MNWVDYCILVVALLSIAVGVLRGFTKEIFSVLTWGLAIGMTLAFGRMAAEALQSAISIPALRVVAGYAACFFGGLLLGALLTLLFVEMVKNSRLASADRTLGAGFGLLRALVLVGVFVMIADNMGAREERWWQRSMLVGRMEWLAGGIQVLVPESWLQAIRPQVEEAPAEQPAAPRQEG